jgi:ATP-binding protein involved in chromosome partitioning
VQIEAMMTEQSPPVESPTYIIAVGSGKGGVGKSTVAVNLAVALAAQGRRVGLLDADVHGPDVGMMLGVRQRAATRSASLAIASRGTLKAAQRVPAIERFGVRTFSVGMMIGERQAVQMDGRFVGMLVRQLVQDVDWGPLDMLLIDLPPGTAEPHNTVAREMHLAGVVLVTTPQEVAQIGTARMLQFYEAAGVPILGTVLNMAYFICSNCDARHIIWPHTATETGPLRYPILAELPLAPDIATGGDQGCPIVVAAPESVAAQAFTGAAQHIWMRLSENDSPSQPA